MGEIHDPPSSKLARPSVDLLPNASNTKHTQSSSPPKFSQFSVSDSSVNTRSQPPSRSPSPSPQKFGHTRHTQKTIDNYFDSPTLDNHKQLCEDVRMQSDEISTATQSMAPSECDSQDSDRSSPHLKPPEPKQRRASNTRRPAGERDDGGCNLPSPPPPLLRPTTFWKNTPRSALAGPAYSPSTHLIRRSTWVAAGLESSGPVGDISALCVESRTKTDNLILPPETIYNPMAVMQVSANPRPQLNPTAASTSMNRWPYSYVSVFVAPTSISYTAFNPIPLISLAPPTSSRTSTATLSSSPSSITSTSLYTIRISSTSTASLQTTGSSFIGFNQTGSSSTASSTTTAQEPIQGQVGRVNFFYFIPAGVVLGAMLGASFTVVLTRRCRQRSGEIYSHPFPAEAGLARFDDNRDEQEKRWIEDLQAYSEDDYETDSNGAFSPRPLHMHQAHRRTSSHSTDYSIDHQGPRVYGVANTAVPISESFYDEALAESKALELNLSSDEEPPTPYAQLRKNSIPRVLLRNIDQAHDNNSQGYDDHTAPLRTHQQKISQSARAPGVPPLGTRPFSISSPVQRVLSPRQMRELFFVDQADLSRHQWATAEKILEEDSDEDGAVERAILQAGTRKRRGISQEHRSLVQAEAILTSISTSPTTVAPRRLVKPTHAAPKQALSALERREVAERALLARKNPGGFPHDTSSPFGDGGAAPLRNALGRVAEIIGTGWSQRDLISSQLSPTSFFLPPNSHAEQQVRGQPKHGKAVTFGIRKSDDGIEHRLGFHP